MDDDVTVGKFYATFLIQDYFRSYPVSLFMFPEIFSSRSATTVVFVCTSHHLVRVDQEVQEEEGEQGIDRGSYRQVNRLPGIRI